MPICKNDPNKSYKGDEPSPKGLGYCAHAEKIGLLRKGKDGNIWEVKETSKGIKRWVKQNNKKIPNNSDKNLDCSKFVIYTKGKKTTQGTEFITGIIKGLSLRKGYIYKYIDFNLFEDKETKIPNGFTKRKISKEDILDYCDKNRQMLLKNNEAYKKIKDELKGYKTYFIHENYDRPFLVYVKNNTVHIYKIPTKKYYYREKDYSLDDSKNKPFYIELVKIYKTKKMFIGKSPLTPMTKFSGGHGSTFNGNTILLQIETNKYVYIGSNIYEFKTNDIIEDYYSPIGNNDVPYPVALGTKNIYFMLDKTYVPNNKFENLTNKDKIDAYSYYYGHSGDEKLSKYSEKMKSIKILKIN